MGRPYISLGQIIVSVGNFGRLIIGEGVRVDACQNLEGINQSKKNKNQKGFKVFKEFHAFILPN